LHQLGKPILLSEAGNNNGAKTLSGDKYCCLKSALHLTEAAQDKLKQNISAPLGLGYGTTSVAKAFVFVEGIETPFLPEYLWVDCGDQQGYDLLCQQSEIIELATNLSGD
jgi:hypothetical protein